MDRQMVAICDRLAGLPMSFTVRDVAVPFNSLAHPLYHIPKQRHRVTNRAAHDAGLRGRGSPTIWFTEAAIPGRRAET
jgi:hypothetical protein